MPKKLTCVQPLHKICSSDVSKAAACFGTSQVLLLNDTCATDDGTCATDDGTCHEPKHVADLLTSN